MSDTDLDLVIIYEHPEWQKPLFNILNKRKMSYHSFDLKKASFSDEIFDEIPNAKLYFNQASPSAYVRGNTRAVPFNLALLEFLELNGKRVINGSKAFRFELSKMTQIAMMKKLKISYPKTIAFNDVNVLKNKKLQFPMILKPNQGGSGARMFKINSLIELKNLLLINPELWLPDNLLLLQEFLPHDSNKTGIVRLEFMGGQLLYAMHVISNGNFNLCPSDYCNPEEIKKGAPTKISFDLSSSTSKKSSLKFIPFPNVPKEAVELGKKIMLAGGLDIGAVEYIELLDGKRVYYDINANSNLRLSVGKEFGFNPFEKVADWLESEIYQHNIKLILN